MDNSVWCNDKSVSSGLGYGTNDTDYGATQRLVSTNGSAGGTGPSLKCNGELSKITSKVGLITADELAYAGYAYRLKNSTTYLQENATDTYWCSLSPVFFSSNVDVWDAGGSAVVWGVNDSRGSFGFVGVGFAIGVRPSISLKSTTNVTGEGTSSSPFIISM